MGLFDKIKGILKGPEETPEQKAKKEEEKARREELNRLNPRGKDLAWFASEDGLAAFKEYTTPQNYLLEENLKKEADAKEYSVDIIAKVKYPDARLPYTYFKSLVEGIKVQPLQYVGPIEALVAILSIQARTFYLDEDGEPHQKDTYLPPEVIVSVEKNPALNYVANFNCFELKDDALGSWEDKWHAYRSIINFLGAVAIVDPDYISKNQWIFAKETYFNDLGVVRKHKAFLKKCIELSTIKDIFEHELQGLE